MVKQGNLHPPYGQRNSAVRKENETKQKNRDWNGKVIVVTILDGGKGVRSGEVGFPGENVEGDLMVIVSGEWRIAKGEHTQGSCQNVNIGGAARRR